MPGFRKDTKRLVFMVFLFAASIGSYAATTTPAASHARQKAPAVRHASCEKWAPLPTCYVSWYRLLANPEAYRGKIVWLNGYLVSDFGDLILYPDEADFASGDEAGSIILQRPFAIPRDIADKAEAGVYSVVVMGRFTPEAATVGFGKLRAGSLYDIRKITTRQRVRSGEPLNRDGIRLLPPEG